MTGGADPPEPANILVPTGDPEFDPAGHPKPVEMAFNRSVYDPSSGSDATNPRQQLNETTSWIDASNVYGSNTDRAAALRTMADTGRLRTRDGDLLPITTNVLPFWLRTISLFSPATYWPMNRSA